MVEEQFISKFVHGGKAKNIVASQFFIYIRSWVRRRHVFEKHRHTGPTGGTLRMRKEGIPKLFGRNNAILQQKYELDW